jgi:hypothetical protein
MNVLPPSLSVTATSKVWVPESAGVIVKSVVAVPES